MNNRICPPEEVLGEYLGGSLPPIARPGVEKHLASCNECRRLLAEAHDILKKPDISEIIYNSFIWIKDNRWFLGAMASLALSFIFHRYFLQFLAACFISGAKWIIDSKTTRTLIMIHEAWKKSEKSKIKTSEDVSHYL